MKHQSVISICTWVLTAAAFFCSGALADAAGVVYNDLNGNNVRDAGEEGIAGVQVSNGTDVVTTDSKGWYEISVSDDCIIFVIKPSGWRTPIDENNLPLFYYIHKPVGSPSELKFPGIKPTGPLPESIDFALQRQDEPDEFNVFLFGDIQARNHTEVNYFRHVIGEIDGSAAAFGISLGDNAFDRLDVLEGLNEAASGIGLPWYNTSGNHDINFVTEDDAGSLETFKSIYGPANYSFNYANAHFIILDSIMVKKTEDGRVGYDEGLGREELTFIANDLKHVDKDKLVVLLMHGGLHLFGSERDELFALLKDFDNTLSIAGHNHYIRNIIYDESENFHGEKPHLHFVAGAVCGGWWSGVPEPLTGIPHSMMRDGTPNGYAALNVNGNEYSIKYKAFGRAEDYQMNIYAPDEVSAGKTAETVILANIFAGSEKSLVQMRLDDSQWLEMQPSSEPDPYFVKMVEWEKNQNLARPNWSNNPESLHTWQANLLADIEQGLHVITVKTTDMFDQTFSSKKFIKITE
ncbi:Calcineurin-like phosphoesterase [Limihaloglobus sulfuriphilus]|uniref:Calcineurin-like phosphoesterase n=1 Tax=Limihaloglobus sulfuriphilus TaxID=1851148 RepID=A0A1Q2MHS7_9BACT|nr:calcineurin-like phosphoesterase family protein [Limihaloglobus sulfuriphilus]AQQ72240.1 Calcineurin-like phosphoesterase [Limihaloglobus sulfuriphilus]